MSRLLAGELQKLATTRTFPGFLLAGAAFSVLNVVIVGLASGDLDELGEKQEVLAGLPLVALLLGVVGVAGEHRHRTAAPAALVARRDRGTLLLARTGAYALGAHAVGCVMTGVSVGVGLPVLGGHPGAALETGDVLPVAAGCVAAAVLLGTLGAAVGALVRHQVGAVIGALVVGFVLTPLLATAAPEAAHLTPFGAASVLAWMEHGVELAPGHAALVLLGWTVPLVAVAVVAERRRDLA